MSFIQVNEFFFFINKSEDTKFFIMIDMTYCDWYIVKFVSKMRPSESNIIIYDQNYLPP